MEKRYLDRPPRIQPELPSGTVEIPEPPREENPQPLWQLAVPIVTILAYVIVSASGSGSNPAFLLPMALTVLISTGIAVFNAVRIVQRRRQGRADYQRKLVELRREMVGSHQRQRAYYEYNYPPIEAALAIKGERDNRGGSRLWERRPNDPDFGHLRLGIGTRASTVSYTFKDVDGSAESAQNQDAQRLYSDSRYLDSAPITLPLFQVSGAKAAPTRNLIGITGKPSDVYEFIYALTAHFAVFHAPTDSALNIIGLREAAKHWLWAAALPHTAADAARGRTSRLYFEDMELLVAPENGRLISLVESDKSVNAGEVIAVIETPATATTPAAKRYVEAVFPGRLAWTLKFDPKTPPVVQKGQLLARMNSFRLSDQQFEEIKKPDYDLIRKQGSEQKKRDLAGIPRFWKEMVWSDLDGRARRARDRGDDRVLGDTMLPFLLTIVDLLKARPDSSDDPLGKSWLYDLESEQALSLVANQGRDLGAAILFLVPTRSKIPSACQAIIELKRDDADGRLRFLYAETGAPTTGEGAASSMRIVGDADRAADVSKLIELATALDGWKVRRSYGADIPQRVALLKMYDADDLSTLDIAGKWIESRDPLKADWPKVPIGMLPGSEARELHFFADADGVHGMIAGATGSGKSELLMTLILSLAIKYDPSVVNFVLIDYKGGAAFEPFRNLPHVVDVVTNLRGNAVARMFAAIQAELNRRQTINQDTDVKDIIRYRQKELHVKRTDYYPHLFIIIDEFAEMIANNAEYKAQLDSITRLGRALGVSLILAAQRPSGVTDQMRANIKMKLCLRVETKEESSEMLRMPDASYLPSIPGRGYLQIGNESLQLIQVGYTGQDYPYGADGKHDRDGDSSYDPTRRYLNTPVVWERMLEDEEPEKLYEVLVREMHVSVDMKYANGKPREWKRPWPRPLPDRIALNKPDAIEVAYLSEDERKLIPTDAARAPGDQRDMPLTLCPAINEWMIEDKKRRRPDWGKVVWGDTALHAVVGVIDDPSRARLRLLEINLTSGHHVVFGASGYGKTVFMQSLITALAVTHSPSALHLYILDLGSRQLGMFAKLPHTGAYIVSHEAERVARLMRRLEQIVEDRKVALNEASAANLLEFNARQVNQGTPDKIMPAIVVAIDNFAEFKENYEQHSETLTGLLREGLGAGVYFVITGEQTNAVGKLFNLIPERLTLRLSDDGEYAPLVGRGARLTEEIPGRGLRRIERAPLEIQVAVPIGLTEDDPEDPEDETARATLERFKLDRLIDHLGEAAEKHGYAPPPPIIELTHRLSLAEVMKDYELPEGQPLEIVLGRDDYNLSVKAITLETRAHFVVSGAPASGKTTALQTMILSLAENAPPRRVGLVLIDYQKGIADYGSPTRSLADLPHVLDNKVITTGDELQDLERHLRYELSQPTNARSFYVFIDNYDEMEAMTKSVPIVLTQLSELAKRYGKSAAHRGALHFIVAMTKTTATLPKDELFRQIGAIKYGLGMDIESTDAAPLHGNVPRSYKQSPLPRGRSFVVQPGDTRALQVALPSLHEADRASELDERIDGIDRQHRGERAVWLPLPVDPTANGSSANGSRALSVDERECVVVAIMGQRGITVDSGLKFTMGRRSLDGMTADELIAEAKKMNIVLSACLPNYQEVETR
ncbi:MAG: FtsK/SpoIIIE domain-containing protein [Chloroflexota bacterium]|nr:FtsK/SpoIIIE domain-containing protein [Chloroflexota bacterium]